MSENKENAIDLIVEGLHSIRPELRTRAKKLNCEQELDEIKDELLKYLHTVRCSHLNK
jgi:hypothetical protein